MCLPGAHRVAQSHGEVLPEGLAQKASRFKKMIASEAKVTAEIEASAVPNFHKHAESAISRTLTSDAGGARKKNSIEKRETY